MTGFGSGSRQGMESCESDSRPHCLIPSAHLPATHSIIDLEWYVAGALGGCVGFALTVVFAVLIVRNVGFAFVVGDLGFFCGFLGACLAINVGTAAGLDEKIKSLLESRTGNLQDIEAATTAYDKASKEYATLLGRYKLEKGRRDAVFEIQRLEAEFEHFKTTT